MGILIAIAVIWILIKVIKEKCNPIIPADDWIGIYCQADEKSMRIILRNGERYDYWRVT